MKIETQCLHEGYHPKNGEPRVLPIYQSTTYTYDSTEHIGKLFDLTADGHMYSRISNPTVAAVEEKIAAMEGGVGALCTTSGQAASLISLLNIMKAGDHFISVSSIYGGDNQSICSNIENDLVLSVLLLTQILQRKRYKKNLEITRRRFSVKQLQIHLFVFLI